MGKDLDSLIEIRQAIEAGQYGSAIELIDDWIAELTEGEDEEHDHDE